MYRHVLCVYPYRRELKRVGFFPPLGLEFIGAVIHPHSQAIDIVDLRREEGRSQDFLRADTDLVCFSVNWDLEAEFVGQEILSIPSKIFTVVGGRLATEDPEHWLENYPNVDVVVRGDGEEAMEDICRGEPLERIDGLSFRRDGGIVHNRNRKPGPVKDDLWPIRKLRRYDYDISAAGIDTGLQIDTLSGSRGCPFNCTFCSFSRNPWGEKRKWSARSAESVVEELAQIRAPFVAFTDDLFTFDLARVGRICDLILAQGIRKKYLVNARLEIAQRPDLLRKMERAGFFLLMVGIESAQDKTLRSMRKGFNTEQIREYFKVLRRSSMVLHGYFILGNIGESVREMLEISSFARELGVDNLGLSTLRATRHSGMEDLVAANAGYHIAPNGKVYSDQCSAKQIRMLRSQIYRQFYTLAQLLQLVGKGFRCGLLRFVPTMLLRLPRIAWRTALNKLHKKQRRRKKQDLGTAETAAGADQVGPAATQTNK